MKKSNPVTLMLKLLCTQLSGRDGHSQSFTVQKEARSSFHNAEIKQKKITLGNEFNPHSENGERSIRVCVTIPAG